MSYKVVIFIISLAILEGSSLTTTDYIDVCNKGDTSFLSKVISKYYTEMLEDTHKKVAKIDDWTNPTKPPTDKDSALCTEFRQALAIMNYRDVNKNVHKKALEYLLSAISPQILDTLNDFVDDMYKITQEERSDLENCFIKSLSASGDFYDKQVITFIKNIPKCVKNTFTISYCELLAELATNIEKVYSVGNSKPAQTGQQFLYDYLKQSLQTYVEEEICGVHN